jgi:hypothetical protein
MLDAEVDAADAPASAMWGRNQKTVDLQSGQQAVLDESLDGAQTADGEKRD